MTIQELHKLTDTQTEDILALMEELDPDIPANPEALNKTVGSGTSHFFAAVEEDGHVSGCATLCIYYSPTGRKASVEDVVVGSAFRGRKIGRQLMEHLIDFASREFDKVDIHLTSRPHRTAANDLYKKLGFQQRETNAYVMKLSH